jgi:phosphate uptake regulator
MYTRKVQKVSTGTLTISLPKSWASRRNVKSGSTVTIEETAAGHLLVMQGTRTPVAKELHLTDTTLLEESLIAAYILGVNTLVVSSPASEVRARIMSVLHYLPGFEVASETERAITLRCLLDEQDIKFYPLLDRLSVLLEHGAKLAIAGNATALRQNEQEIDRVYHLCQRTLTHAAQDSIFLERAGIPSVQSIPTFQLLVKRLEHIGDALEEIPPKLSPAQQRVVIGMIGIITSLLRLLTVGKLTNARLAVREEIQSSVRGHTLPQILFLAKTAEDIREELVRLHLSISTFTER